MAHATVALREFLTGDISSDLSEQFLYWYCKENDGIPHSSGTFIDVAIKGLVTTGVCKETTWPYNYPHLPEILWLRLCLQPEQSYHSLRLQAM